MLTRTWSTLTAIFLIAQGGVHLQQYLKGYSAIPTIGPLFMVNVVVAGLLATAVVVRANKLVLLSAVAFSVGSFAALMLTQTVGLFGFQEGVFNNAHWATVAAELGTVVAIIVGRVTTATTAETSTAPAKAERELVNA